MSDQYSLASSRAKDLIAKAEALQPVLAERAARCAQIRRIPDETIQDFQDAGFFKILQPEQWGGYAMDPQVFYAVQLKISEACMSSGWVLGVVAVHNWQLALFDNQAAQDVWSEDPTTLISSSYAPVGKVEKVDGGYKLSGQWGFSSGSEHCEWVFLGAVVPEEGAPFDMSNYRTFMVPKADYEIIDTWHVVGLQGTGSQDIKVVDAFVPEYRTHKLFDGFNCENPGNAVNKAPVFRLPFGQVFVRAVCTGSLGALEGELGAFIEVAKTRQVGPAKMKDDPFARKIAAEVRSAIDEMKSTMYRNFDEMMAVAAQGSKIDLEDRARYRYDSALVADRCVELSGKMLKASGSKGIFLGNQVLAKHLDILASQAHVANNTNIYSNNLGGMIFGDANIDLNM
ncbi:acyl-CoA dehydrogenase family protein [Oceanicoccus sp. KOV_DT_Chl]|uniref:acyl-CoA dehydrogenase family protein n=1 Tax=Oceanicoccus sp. KOV_DT_Chl TaxID=1904639 RepID=UPI000C7AAB5A|nr:acyl-CoA dehydrogenase family protein [Oceanicoccus sp. KOV_DT_Chl]